jgi:hypothetical protein
VNLKPKHENENNGTSHRQLAGTGASEPNRDGFSIHGNSRIGSVPENREAAFLQRRIL